MFHREHPLVSRPICLELARLEVKENTMNKREIVQALMDAVQKGDFENAKSMLADDFQFSGPVPEPINAETWLGMSASLRTAFPHTGGNQDSSRCPEAVMACSSSSMMRPARGTCA